MVRGAVAVQWQSASAKGAAADSSGHARDRVKADLALRKDFGHKLGGFKQDLCGLSQRSGL